MKKQTIYLSGSDETGMYHAELELLRGGFEVINSMRIDSMPDRLEAMKDADRIYYIGEPNRREQRHALKIGLEEV